MTTSVNPVGSAEGHDLKTNRTGTSELITGLGVALTGAGIAAIVLRTKGISSVNALSFASRGVALYATFQLVPFFRKHVDAKLNRTLKTMAAVWLVSVMAQGLNFATAFAKPLLIAIALVDFALRSAAFAQARSVTTQLHRSAANTLVIGSIARLAAGAMMITLAASGATRLSTSAGMIVVAELGATLLAASFVEMSLPKHFAAKSLQTTNIATSDATTTALTLPPESTQNTQILDQSSDDSDDSDDSIDSIDVVLDLRHTENIQAGNVQKPVLSDTVVDLREHAKAVVAQ